jgi:hypothetical protein
MLHQMQKIFQYSFGSMAVVMDWAMANKTCKLLSTPTTTLLLA